MHAYWEQEGGQGVLELVGPSARAHLTPLMALVGPRFRPAPSIQLPNLSLGSSTAILQHVADAATYRHRLEYSISALSKLEKTPIHAALAGAIEAQLLLLPPFDPQSVLECATSLPAYLGQLYQLCKVIGCQDLTQDISLESLPAAWTILDRCFDLSWPLFIGSIEPWLTQLFRMIQRDNSTSARVIWKYPSVYVGDMFTAIRDRFMLVEERIPQFLPLKYAKMAVECINYRLIIELDPEFSATQQVHHRKLPAVPQNRRPIADPFANTSGRQYTFTKPKVRQIPKDTENKFYSVYELLTPINTAHGALHREWHQLLQPLLRTHLDIISNVFFLMNGNLWMLLREEIHGFRGRPTIHQLEPINKFIHTIAPPCISVTLQMDENLISCPSDNLTIEYSPPPMLQTIITRALIDALCTAFSLLLELQQENRKRPTESQQLNIYSTALRHHVLELKRVIKSQLTFDTVVQAFETLQHAILNQPAVGLRV